MVAAVSLACSMAACGSIAAVEGAPDGPTIAIGVAVDEPGMSWWHDGEYSGFDITVARYVAKALGYADKQIEFTSITPRSGDQLLEQGQVDLLVSALTMDAGSLAHVEYAGPYMVADQELLIHHDDAGTLSTPQSLEGRTVCTASGSGAETNLVRAVPKVVVRPRDSYPQCLTALMIGEADAVSADGAVLAGLAHSYGGGYLTLIRQPLARAEHGVRVKAGNTQLARKVDEALRNMRNDGSWSSAVRTLERETGYRVSRQLNATYASHQ